MRSLLILLLLAVTASARLQPELDPYFDALALEAAAKASAAAKAAQRGEPRPSDKGFDQVHLKLELTLEYFDRIAPVWCTLDGTATWSLKSTRDALDTVVMELSSELTVSAVRRGTTPLDFTHSADTLTITLDRSFSDGEAFSVAIDYHGVPDYGMYASPANGGIIHTFTEPYDASGWFPCYDMPDDRFTYEGLYTVRDDWLVASNGDDLPLVQDLGDGTKTYHWSASFEMPTYLVALGASDYHYFYDTFDIGHGPRRVDNWVYREHIPEAEEDLSITPEMVEVCSELFTDYRYPRYGHMITPIGGAMEHTTTTSYSSGLIIGDHTYDWVVVHELGHQWFGDWITCRTWENIWLNEGFASYVEALWAEYLGGAEALKNYMAVFRTQYFYEDSYYRYPLYDPDFLFGTTVYKKGAWVLHMLRHLGSDDDFLAMLQEYVEDDSDGLVTTEELISVAEGYYGGRGSLDGFFEQWVYKAGYPEYDVMLWNEETADGWLCHVQLSQVQDPSDGITPEVFATPVDLELATADGAVSVVFDNDRRVDEQAFEVPAPVTGLEFDPDGWLLYKLLSSDAPVVIFTAAPGEDGVLVAWSVEGGPPGVELYREDGTGELKLHESRLEAQGRFLDRPAHPGSYRYRLEVLAADGRRASYFTSFVDWRDSTAPLAMSAAWPCPAAQGFSVAFNLPRPGAVRLFLYDLAGRRVGTLVEGDFTAGRHELYFPVDWLTSGVYVLRLDAGGGCLTRRVVVAR